MSARGLLPLVAVGLLGGCYLEPDYTGIACATSVPCPGGYRCDLDRSVCVSHVDACTSSRASCGANASCVDTFQGWVCTCDLGFVGDGASCTADDSILAGFALSVWTLGQGWRLDQPPPAFEPTSLRYAVAVPIDTTKVRATAWTRPEGGTVDLAGQAMVSGQFLDVPVEPPVTLALTSTGRSGRTTRYLVELSVAPP